MLDKIDGRVPATAGMNTPAGMPQPNFDNKIASQSGTEVQSKMELTETLEQLVLQDLEFQGFR